MEILDSPLNLAHQQSRKADKCLKSCRFEESIECHKRAADYLTQAMTSTNIPQALESLCLQRESHIRQQAIIQEKQRRSLMSERQTPDRSTATTGMSDKVSEHVTSMDQSNSILVYRTMQECDSLLQFLNNRTSKEELYQPVKPEREEVVGTKAPKDEKVIIDELRTHNEALRSHVLQFLKEAEENRRELDFYQRELEYTRRDNRELKDRLSKVEHSGEVDCRQTGQETDTFYSMPMALNLDKLPALELPPLEMPKFDFDSLKSNQEEESVASQ